MSLQALCIPLLQRRFSLPDALLQGCQPAIPLLLALLAKQFTGHPLQREDAHRLRTQVQRFTYRFNHWPYIKMDDMRGPQKVKAEH